MQRLIKYIFIGLFIGIGVTFFYKKVYIPKLTYKLVKPTEGNLTVKVYGIGTIGAEHISNITAQTGGKIVSILTDEGKWVKKNDLLITIDSVDMIQLLEEAKINVKKAFSEKIATQKEINGLLAQKKLAQITYNRYAKLRKNYFVSKAEYDKVKSDLDVIKSQISTMRVHISSSDMDIARAKKSVEALKEKLSRYKIYAPISGYVISRDAEVAQTVLPSKTILEIVNPKSVWIKSYIDESLSGDIKLGQSATIKLRSQPKRILLGSIKRISLKSDAVTKEREVDISFNKLPIPFYINEQAEVAITTKRYNHIVKIPSNAIIYNNGQDGIWIEKEHKAHFMAVEIIARGDNEIGVNGIDKNSNIIIKSDTNRPLKEGLRIYD